MDRDEIERVGETMVYFRSTALRICLSWSFLVCEIMIILRKKKRDAIRERDTTGEEESGKMRYQYPTDKPSIIINATKTH
jgi:hypothetical protein